ncbi:hypothetical protein Prum_078890 [Phytohabitans rumicis]|uniref:Uncharacterized protein n=1 Tax=Phytohabitans rumicis TaxID=1076125 RepID=A0A6V8LJK0_9ACTN|nr:hypothetical protein Prum_078890 [Phytohabitans rumicis]
MADAEFVHEFLDERRTFIAHELLPAPELGAAGAPVEAPVAERVDDRKSLDASFGEAVASALPRAAAPRVRIPASTRRTRRSARMFEAMPSIDPVSSARK